MFETAATCLRRHFIAQFYWQPETRVPWLQDIYSRWQKWIFNQDTMRIILITAWSSKSAGRSTASGARNDENCESSCKPGRFPRRPGDVNEQRMSRFDGFSDVWLTSFGYIHIVGICCKCIARMMIPYPLGCWHICPHNRANVGECASTMEYLGMICREGHCCMTQNLASRFARKWWHGSHWFLILQMAVKRGNHHSGNLDKHMTPFVYRCDEMSVSNLGVELND